MTNTTTAPTICNHCGAPALAVERGETHAHLTPAGRKAADALMAARTIGAL